MLWSCPSTIKTWLTRLIWLIAVMYIVNTYRTVKENIDDCNVCRWPRLEIESRADLLPLFPSYEYSLMRCFSSNWTNIVLVLASRLSKLEFHSLVDWWTIICSQRRRIFLGTIVSQRTRVTCLLSLASSIFCTSSCSNLQGSQEKLVNIKLFEKRTVILFYRMIETRRQFHC